MRFGDGQTDEWTNRRTKEDIEARIRVLGLKKSWTRPSGLLYVLPLLYIMQRCLCVEGFGVSSENRRKNRLSIMYYHPSRI